MIILGIESSAVSAGAAIVLDGKLLCEYNLCTGLTHSQTLMPLVDNVLKMTNIDIKDVDVIAVSDGPGSFTGLRIGIGTAKGLAMGADSLVVGVSPLLGLAYNISLTDAIIAPIMDARRGEVYNALYKYQNGEIKQVIAARALPVSQLASELCEEKVMFVGDGVPVCRQSITEIMGTRALFAPENLMYQRAGSIAMAALTLKAVSYEELVPKYIRKPQAEREFNERVGKHDSSGE